MKIIDEISSGQNYKLGGGQYDVYLRDTTLHFYAASNNDASTKSIAIHIKDKSNITIDGEGAVFMFHDRISPIVIDACENITLKNFSIDYERKFYTQGKIIKSDCSMLELAVDDCFAYEVNGGSILFKGENWENNTSDCIMLFQEFNYETKTLAFDSPVLIYRIGVEAKIDETSPLPMRILTAEQTKAGTLLLKGEFPYTYKAGNAMVMTHERRENPGIFITNSKNILLQNINILHTGSMGIISQLSENITLDGINISVNEHSVGLVSTNCDATHFVGCRGHIEIKNCLLESMLDDGVNIHGVYTKIEEKDGTNTLFARIMHFQQFFVPLYNVGDTLVVYEGQTSKKRANLTVSAVTLVNEQLFKIETPQDTTDILPGDFIENISATPSVHIHHTKTGKNRPRGFLPTTPKKVLIEHCTLYSPCFGIHVAGDTKFWYESGGVKDFTVRNCHFIDCGVQMGDYCIAFTPEFDKTTENPFFHRNILIENNIFETFTDGAVYATGVESIAFKNNKYIKTNSYPKRINSKLFEIE